MSTQQEYIQSLVQNETKLNLEEFFKDIHKKFYPNQDISFMKYFLELTDHEGEFYVNHEKLIEYGKKYYTQRLYPKVEIEVKHGDFRLFFD